MLRRGPAAAVPRAAAACLRLVAAVVLPVVVEAAWRWRKWGGGCGRGV